MHLLSSYFPMTIHIKHSLLAICKEYSARCSVFFLLAEKPVLKLSTLFLWCAFFSVAVISLKGVFSFSVPLTFFLFDRKIHESKICFNAFLVHVFWNRPISINLSFAFMSFIGIFFSRRFRYDCKFGANEHEKIAGGCAMNIMLNLWNEFNLVRRSDFE